MHDRRGSNRQISSPPMGFMGKGKTMKKLFTQVVKKNGELKDVYVCVDDETARVLEQVDEDTRKAYLQDEYEMITAENYHKRHTQSLDKSLENGFDIADERQDVEENVVREMENERVRNAIEQLEPQQQWLVEQIYCNERTRVNIAKELGVSEFAIRDRLKRIHEKIKKFLS